VSRLPSPPEHLLRGASLFLDFDGTIVEIAESPDAVRVDGKHVALLRRLAVCLDGRVAIISGRPAGQVRDLLQAKGMTVVGSHGLEFLWSDGRTSIAERPRGLKRATQAMSELAGRHPGCLVEEKPLGVALHYRLSPRAEEEGIALAVRLAPELGLQLQHGKMMVELRAAGGDKGSAVRALMREKDFAGTRPVFLGDDLTDEPAFLAARALGGAGVLIGQARSSAATFRLAGVQDALIWLDMACGIA